MPFMPSKPADSTFLDFGHHIDLLTPFVVGCDRDAFKDDIRCGTFERYKSARRCAAPRHNRNMGGNPAPPLE
jgi:hypothetical protein